MNKNEAHALLNAAKAGMFVQDHLINQALMATGDLAQCKRKMQRREKATHFAPAFSPEEPRPEPRPKEEVVIPSFPSIVHKPWSLECAT